MDHQTYIAKCRELSATLDAAITERDAFMNTKPDYSVDSNLERFWELENAVGTVALNYSDFCSANSPRPR